MSIINHNLMAMNAVRNAGINTTNASKSMQKLASGVRINGAQDDAAGLAISEKMRGQISGLDQASRNALDGQSMVQTAEGALNATTTILQRMRTLAVQSGNDSNVTVDRSSIQAEMNQLSSEINRIGNTTEFNTQKVLAGGGSSNVPKTGYFNTTALTGGIASYNQASATIAVFAQGAAAGDAFSISVGGQDITITFAATDAMGQASGAVYNVTGNSATVNIMTSNLGSLAGSTASEITNALTKIFLANSTLSGNYIADKAVASSVVIQAVTGSVAQGAAGSIASATFTGVLTASGIASVGVTKQLQASAVVLVGANFTGTNLLTNGGEGITLGGTTVQFYDGSKGSYKGDAVGIDIRTSSQLGDIILALQTQSSSIPGVSIASSTTAGLTMIVTSTAGGVNGNTLNVKDGGDNTAFKATFQVGANQGQQFNINVNDMRSVAIGVTGAAAGTDSATGAQYTATTVVTNGTDTITREAALDVSSSAKATNAIKTIDNAINNVSAERAKLGAYSNRLDYTVSNLGTTSETMSAAESRIRDVNMATEMMNYQKSNVLAQAAQAMISQANQQPQQVLSLLR